MSSGSSGHSLCSFPCPIYTCARIARQESFSTFFFAHLAVIAARPASDLWAFVVPAHLALAIARAAADLAAFGFFFSMPVRLTEVSFVRK